MWPCMMTWRKVWRGIMLLTCCIARRMTWTYITRIPPVSLSVLSNHITSHYVIWSHSIALQSTIVILGLQYVLAHYNTVSLYFCLYLMLCLCIVLFLMYRFIYYVHAILCITLFMFLSLYVCLAIFMFVSYAMFTAPAPSFSLETSETSVEIDTVYLSFRDVSHISFRRVRAFIRFVRKIMKSTFLIRRLARGGCGPLSARRPAGRKPVAQACRCHLSAWAKLWFWIIYIYIYIYVYMCRYVCIYIYIYACIYTYIYIYIHVLLYAYT